MVMKMMAFFVAVIAAITAVVLIGGLLCKGIWLLGPTIITSIYAFLKGWILSIWRAIQE